MNKAEKPAVARSGALRFVVRLGVSAAVLFILLQFIPAGDLWRRVTSVSPLLWLGVFFAFFVGHVLSAAKWRMMIGGDIDFPRALKAHFAGLAANLVLPGVAGGDIVRAGIVMKGSDRKTALAVGSLVERLIDTAALVVVAAVGAVLIGAEAGEHPLALGLVAGFVVLGGVLGVAFARPVARLAAAKAPKGKLGAFIRKLAAAIEETAARRGAFVLCAILSIAIQASFAHLNGLIAVDLGSDAPLAAWIFAWPLAKLIATLPISFGGLGVREASLVGLLTPLGYDSAGIVAAGLVWQSIQFAGAGLGALMQLFWRGADGKLAETTHG